jgi:hypothetical protein
VAPGVRLAVRFEDMLSGPRRVELAAAVAALREDFVPLDEVAIEQTILGKLNRTPAQRSIQAIGALGYDVVIAKLEVGGASEAAAALNLETLLRVLYAEPAVQGIYLAGLREDQLAAPNAALLDASGQPTLPGRVFQTLVAGWHTDLRLVTDELGEARLRVFPGALRIVATVQGAEVAQTTVWVDRSRETRVIVLQGTSSGEQAR